MKSKLPFLRFLARCGSKTCLAAALPKILKK